MLYLVNFCNCFHHLMVPILAMWCQRHATNDTKLGVGTKEMNVIDA
jgi:hypothetical protein